MASVEQGVMSSILNSNASSSNDINSCSDIYVCLVRVGGRTVYVVAGGVIVIVDIVDIVVDCDGDVIEGSVVVVVVDGGDTVVLFDPDIRVIVNATSVSTFVATKQSSSLCITNDCKSILSSSDIFKLFKI